MGKAREIADALQQVEEEHITCPTCDAPVEEGKRYCTHCRMYWEDVRNGLFDFAATEDSTHAE